MKRLALVCSLFAVAAADVAADPPAAKSGEGKSASTAKKKHNQASARPEAAKPAAATTFGPTATELGVEPRRRRPHLDLFPSSVLGRAGRKAEEGPITLGDDSDWRVQAAQVGAMAAIFGALVGLCSGGRCMVPEAATNALPSWMRAKPQFVPDPRPPEKVRQAH